MHFHYPQFCIVSFNFYGSHGRNVRKYTFNQFNSIRFLSGSTRTMHPLWPAAIILSTHCSVQLNFMGSHRIIDYLRRYQQTCDYLHSHCLLKQWNSQSKQHDHEILQRHLLNKTAGVWEIQSVRVIKFVNNWLMK